LKPRELRIPSKKIGRYIENLASAGQRDDVVYLTELLDAPTPGPFPLTRRLAHALAPVGRSTAACKSRTHLRPS
jgi:hypothetical protein